MMATWTPGMLKVKRRASSGQTFCGGAGEARAGGGRFLSPRGEAGGPGGGFCITRGVGGGLPFALADEDEILAAMAEMLAEEFFGAGVTGGGVDHVDAGIEQRVDRVCGALLVGAEIGDGGGAKAQRGDGEAGFAEGVAGHGGIVG